MYVYEENKDIRDMSGLMMGWTYVNEDKRRKRYCMNGHLKIVGNCRLCIIENENVGKGVASCNELGVGMSKKVRYERILEGTLCNHPLDCVICDKGGECELQNEVVNGNMRLGRNMSDLRNDVEMSVEENIRMVMSRCIECSECMRDVKDILGVNKMGVIGRNEDVLIRGYVGSGVKRETDKLSIARNEGNIVDVCPVGYLYRC